MIARSSLSTDELNKIQRLAEEPFYWVRGIVPEVKEWDDEFFDLIDKIKQIWDQAKQTRINLAFELKWEIEKGELDALTIFDIPTLQGKQNGSNSTLIFQVDLKGKVIGEIDIRNEIDPAAISALSQMRQVVIFWLGPDLEIFCKGQKWIPKNKREILKDIKSKRRNRILSMDDYGLVLRTHFEQCIRDEGRDIYWFEKNKILQPTPEEIFQRSLWRFLNDEVDCNADREPMFKDGSRCDVRVFLENFDMFFIEIKWVGYSAVKHRDNTIDAKVPNEFGVDRAIDGAFQTKRYIEKNNSPDFDHRIRLGIYLVYDAYPAPVTPINYGDEIKSCALLEVFEFHLVSHSPSVETKGIAKRKGLV